MIFFHNYENKTMTKLIITKMKEMNITFFGFSSLMVNQTDFTNFFISKNLYNKDNVRKSLVKFFYAFFGVRLLILC